MNSDVTTVQTHRVEGQTTAQEKASRLVSWGLAASMTNLLMIRAWFSILYDDDRGYFNQQPVNSPTLLALLLSLLIGTVLGYLVLQTWRRLPWRWPKPLGVLAALALLLIPFNFFRWAIWHIPAATILHAATHPAVMACAAFGGVFVIWKWTWTARLLKMLLLLMFPVCLLSTGKTLLVLAGIAKLRQHEAPPPLVEPLAELRKSPRILWVVFDELDFRLAFPERPANLALPQLDRLKSESLFATNARPPAYGTLLSIPALTSGLRVRNATPASPNDLRLVEEDTGHTNTWSRLPSVFKDVRDLGFNTAIVGWHHPYRRVFSNAVSFCEWHPSPWFELARGPDFVTAFVNQWWSVLTPLQQRRLFIQIHRQTLETSLKLSTNQQFGLVFLHLAPPHRPGIYEPAQDRFTLLELSTVQGYFNNLILVDQALAHLRASLTNAKLDDSTWLLVTSDHSWRESTRFDRRFDERVPWMLKAPGNQTGMEYSIPFNTVATPHLVKAILRGEVRTLAEAGHWLQKHAPNLPSIADLSGDTH